MNIAILGNGRMGHMITELAEKAGHKVILTIDKDNYLDVLDEDLMQADVAIEFSVPEVAVKDIKWCMELGVPIVCGTTGWLGAWDEVVEYCKQKDASFFYSSNYSIGVNIFLNINNYLAKIMDKFSEYSIYLEETHHIHKLDKPSGTAISIANDILKNHSGYDSWMLEKDNEIKGKTIPIKSIRQGEVPGDHSVVYKSGVDEIKIAHSAYSREGFALGAVKAAEFLCDKKGIFGMSDLLKI